MIIPENYIKVKILVGPRAGETVFANWIWHYDNSQQWENRKNRNYKKDWQTLGKVWQAEDAAFQLKNPQTAVEIDGFRMRIGQDVEQIPTAMDTNREEIFVGDIIFYARRDMNVSQMKISELKKVGNNSIEMHGIDLQTNKKTKNSYPTRCWKI